jgi:hypothetical protein
LLLPLLLPSGGNFMAALNSSCQAITCPLSLLTLGHFGPLLLAGNHLLCSLLLPSGAWQAVTFGILGHC